jgi:SAM-dependent methyltransferase
MITVPFRNISKKYNVMSHEKVVDIGGSAAQVTELQIHTLVDIVPPDTYTRIMPLDKQAEGKLFSPNFVQVDIGIDQLPLQDKSFDFCIFTHTLEDLYDPRLILSEIGRIAKRGVIITPSRGKEMEFSAYDLTDWMTGGTRVPGQSHHRWFVEVKQNQLCIIPKYYPLLYTPEFHVVKWSGPLECEYYWEKKPEVNFWDSMDFRDLLNNYRGFMKDNRRDIKMGTVLMWWDSPHRILRAILRRILRKGYAFSLESSRNK